MSFFARFMWGLLIMAMGFMLVWKAEWVFRNFGAIPFAEKFLTTEGGSRLFYKFIGLMTMLIGILFATGLLDNIGAWLLIKFFPGFTK